MTRTMTAALFVTLASQASLASQAWGATINKDAGSSAASFLKLGAGGRAGAMADSFSAIADDAYAAYYNPGGLSQLKGPQLAGGHTSFIRDVNYEVIEFAYPFGKQEQYSRHVLAVGVNYLSVNMIEKRSVDSSDPLGSFDSTDASYGLTYAFGFNRRLSAGVSAKLISQRIDTYHSDTFASDWGILYRVNPDGRVPVAVSAVARNWGTRVSYVSGESDPLPVSFTFGIAAHILPDRLRVNLEGTKYRDTGLFGAAGAEYDQPLMKDLKASFRAGYTSHYRDLSGLNGMAMGMGLTYNLASFDFAWLPFGRLGDTFRYSLILKF
ncbi:MAG: PorV/PorQ family protein [Elusimicrobia bacterium]|nr:PorV/PorQ family protein [Elusimicrobiota bacterium]